MRQYLLLVSATISAFLSGLLVSCSSSDVIPYTKWSGKAIKLINNKQAKDPSWAQLEQEWEELVVGFLWEPNGKVKSVEIYW